MKRPSITVTITDRHGGLHRETRQAFNAGIRASEVAVRGIAQDRRVVLTGENPERSGPRHEVGDTYSRAWVAQDGETFLATVRVATVP